MRVSVVLKNPPSGANKWQMSVIDYDAMYILSWGTHEHGNIEDIASFEIPSGWEFPLYVQITIYDEWLENEEWHKRQLYYVQSLHERLYDWDTGSYTGPPDPDYEEVLIPDYGSYYYNVATEQFEVIEIVPEYSGTITMKELEYDEVRAAIPAYDIPQGQRGLVHIWGRNDMSTNQKMGISWIVSDPDGIVVEEYSTWETFWTGPGNEQHFIGDRFNLDKAGTYILNVGLYMNPDDPEMVDSYYGTLCTVAAVLPEPEFRGFGVSEYVTK